MATLNRQFLPSFRIGGFCSLLPTVTNLPKWRTSFRLRSHLQSVGVTRLRPNNNKAQQRDHRRSRTSGLQRMNTWPGGNLMHSCSFHVYIVVAYPCLPLENQGPLISNRIIYELSCYAPRPCHSRSLQHLQHYPSGQLIAVAASLDESYTKQSMCT